jgi:hypothetical protein
MKKRVTKICYVVYEIGYFSFSLFSRCLNTIAFGGSMHQTLSARTHIEAVNSKAWKKREKVINMIFFFEPDHCAKAWHSEVARARKTLAKNSKNPHDHDH